MAGATMGPSTRPARDGAGGEHWTLAGSVRGPLPAEETAALAERGMARIADPVPMGLAGFAAATFTVSTVLAGWFDLRDIAVTIPVLLVFGGIAQFLAGMWAYARGNILATVAFSSFGSFNTAFAILLLMQTVGAVPNLLAPGSDQSKVAGVFILMFALISAYLALAAMGDNLMISAVLWFLALAYLADGTGTWIGATGGNVNTVLSIGGYAGIVSSLLAFYVSAAFVINSVLGRTLLPTVQVRR